MLDLPAGCHLDNLEEYPAACPVPRHSLHPPAFLQIGRLLSSGDLFASRLRGNEIHWRGVCGHIVTCHAQGVRFRHHQ